jgi:hypothetical protein
MRSLSVNTEDLTFLYGAVAASLFLQIGYNTVMFLSVFTGNGQRTQLHMNIHNSVHWVLKHREKSDSATATLAVQTFRNTIMVAVFVGGNAFQLAFSFANNYQDIVGQPIEQTRSVILATLLFGSFLSWACVIRFASHMGYMIGTLSYTFPSIPASPVPPSMQTANKHTDHNHNGVKTNEENGKDEAASDTKDSSATAADGNINRAMLQDYEAERLRIAKECVRLMSLNMIFFR